MIYADVAKGTRQEAEVLGLGDSSGSKRGQNVSEPLRPFFGHEHLATHQLIFYKPMR